MKQLLTLAFAGILTAGLAACAHDMSKDEMMKKEEMMKKDEMMKKEQMMKKEEMMKK